MGAADSIPQYHYATLGIPLDANIATIQHAYDAIIAREIVDSVEDTESRRRVTLAFEILSNPTSRLAYNRNLRRLNQRLMSRRVIAATFVVLMALYHLVLFLFGEESYVFSAFAVLTVVVYLFLRREFMKWIVELGWDMGLFDE